MDLNVKPESGVVETGTNHILVAEITSPGGCLDTVDCSIDFEVKSGPGDLGDTPENPDYSCPIAAGTSPGSCQVTFTSMDPGTNVILVWIDDDKDASVDADTTEGHNDAVEPGSNPEDDDTDLVEVRWADPGVVTRVDASADTATTSTTKSHTVTCRLVDAFGSGVGQEVCDANIPKGPNKNNNVDNDPATPGGYLGECTTGPAGYCSWTYSSTETGTDTVRVFFDRNLDDLKSGEPSNDVTRTWTSDITTGPCAGLNYGQTAPRPGGGKTIAGTPGDNNKTGTPFADVFCGFSGVDRFDGGGGNDLALGGTGNDTLLGRKGSDNLQGSDGIDNLEGAEGADKIFSGKGNDKTSGGFGNDKIYGDAGIDLVQGYSGHDILAGGDGSDKVKGGSGRDNLSGGSGNDALNGGTGNDSCNGGPGGDTLTSC
jgi:Ca2+-binding RTX toxin-like protein